MTLLDIATTIPGILFLGLVGPALIVIVVGRISYALENRAYYAFSTAQTEIQPKTLPEEPKAPTPRGKNVIDFDTVAAISHIRNHEAMRFVAKN